MKHKLHEKGCGENEAIRRFYESRTGTCYADDETGLYGQSSLYVFSLYEEERTGWSGKRNTDSHGRIS
jgi:hypothetical protein